MGLPGTEHPLPNICGWPEGRSKYARVGMMVHVTAGFIQPGIDNCQVLEIINVSNCPLAIHVGTPICQFIFERTEDAAIYKGTFRDQCKLRGTFNSGRYH